MKLKKMHNKKQIVIIDVDENFEFDYLCKFSKIKKFSNEFDFKFVESGDEAFQILSMSEGGVCLFSLSTKKGLTETM